MSYGDWIRNFQLSGTAKAMQAFLDKASASAADAKASASAAAGSANDASSARASAADAAASAGAAATSESHAAAWAQQPAGYVAGTQSYSAYYYSQQSQYWANIAQVANAVTATLDPGYKSPKVTLSSGNLTATFAGGQAGVIGTVGYSSGKHYFEVTFVSGTSSGNASAGLAPSSEPLNIQIGYDNASSGIGDFQSSGNVYIAGSKAGGASGFGDSGDVLCVAVDMDAKLIWFRTNGGNWNGSATADPVKKVGGFAYAYGGALYPALCSDSAAVFSANFAGNFAQMIPAGFRAWGADAYHYAVPYATAASPGIVSIGSGLTINVAGQVSADTYYSITKMQAARAIAIDLTSPTPGYHVVLNQASATFSLTNLTLPQGKALRLTFHIEQGTGSNKIDTWDARIKWVGGAAPILAYTKGARNVIELETIDGATFAGYNVGQINP
ncbi:SPRY domain protein [Burkholderia ubonensis]|uniref:SPRY domain protein n=1 Tax=Burkholderia ubonensis TaxID=101571 RepID=A0ABD4E0G8_9BURK|nr:SPRY domain protein [Burkholderia ubonensis]KVN83447.1 SPRY domain protein [Burkholderia ubonensis]